VQIFLVYFGLASVGLKLSAFTVAVAALTINVGAYTAEIMRAGFEAIPRGQIEAPKDSRCRASRSTGTSSCCPRSSGSIRR
jgi:ABC-type amino acid transport system permease subunit